MFCRKTKTLSIAAGLAIGLAAVGVAGCKARSAEDGGSAAKSLQTGTRGLMLAAHSGSVNLCVSGFALNSQEVALAKSSILNWMSSLESNVTPFVKDRGLMKGTAGEDPCVFTNSVNAVAYSGGTQACDIVLQYTGQARPDCMVGDMPTIRSGTMAATAQYGYDLNFSMLHEFGHAFGLADTYILSSGQAGNCQPGQPAQSIMCSPYSYRQPQSDDIQGLLTNYMTVWGNQFLDFTRRSEVCKGTPAVNTATQQPSQEIKNPENLAKPAKPVVTQTQPTTQQGDSCFCREGTTAAGQRICGIWYQNNWLTDNGNPYAYQRDAQQYRCDANFCNYFFKFAPDGLCRGRTYDFAQTDSKFQLSDDNNGADDRAAKLADLTAALAADPAKFEDQVVRIPSFFTEDSQYLSPELGRNVDSSGSPSFAKGSGAARHGNMANNCPDGQYQKNDKGDMICANPQESCRLGLTKDEQGDFVCGLFKNNLNFVAGKTGADPKAAQGDLEIALDDVPFPGKSCTILYFEARATVNGNLNAYLNQKAGGAAGGAKKCQGGIFGGPDPREFFAL